MSRTRYRVSPSLAAEADTAELTREKCRIELEHIKKYMATVSLPKVKSSLS